MTYYLDLTPGVRAVLENLLLAAQSLEDGARVVDHLPDEPWGNLDQFRREVYEPLKASAATETRVGNLILAPQDAGRVFGVLEGLAEGWSGGVPWVPLTSAEKAAVIRCLEGLQQLGPD